ncbi:non-ribosomal peptide synthetase [Mitsuaria sp. GD03876]|uniref:non-ribosomal peptide synthetase n=1 Tax=Mitsuaria sp. GD03876 TaxID=2975399 RepID=UPI00244B590B|nr:non-ribosomal peptide synthetase [Mitsuaria sp. GD03876]MDH0865612.1 amino acid adenylation domain-containing protein [Mitsuaria sp. GD03876]
MSIPAEIVSPAGMHSLSVAQQEILFHQLRIPRSPLYNIGGYVDLRQPIDFPRMAEAFGQVLVTHPQLLRRVRFVDAAPAMADVPDAPVSGPAAFRFVDVSAAPSPEDAARDLLRELFERPFDLERESLFSAGLIRLDASRHWYFTIAHHLLVDGWGFANWLREVFGRLTGAWPGSVAMPTSFHALDEQARTAAQAHWRDELLCPPELLCAPLGHAPREGHETTRRLTRDLGADDWTRLQVLCEARGVTPFAWLLAVTHATFQRLHGRDDALYGTPIHNRRDAVSRKAIDLTMQVMPLRVRAGNDAGISRIASDIGRTLRRNYRHGRYPLSAIQQEMNDAARGAAPRASVFDVNVNYQKLDFDFAELGLQADTHFLPNGHELTPLTLTFRDYGAGQPIQLQLDHHVGYFTEASAGTFQTAWFQLLAQSLQAPDAPVAELALLTSEQEALLATFSGLAKAGTAEALPARTLADRVRRHALERPRAPAVIDDDRQLDFAALERLSNRVARALIDAGVRRGEVVGFCLERTHLLPVAVLGVMKAAAVYLPLTPQMPPARIGEAMVGAKARLLLADADTQAHADAVGGDGTAVQVLRIDHLVSGAYEDQTTSGGNDDLAVPSAGQDELAYITFTSGTTGKPKGVQIAHRNLEAIASAWEQVYDLRPERDRWLQLANANFDVFAGDLLRSIGTGNALVMCPRDTLLDPGALLAHLRRHRVTAAEFVPALLREVAAWPQDGAHGLASMRLVVVGSDSWYAVDHARLRAACGPVPRIINTYGVTEAAIDSSYHEPDDAAAPADGMMPIGRPFPGMRLHVVDASLRALPPGVTGELCIGGLGVGPGYLERPELNRDKFVPDPWGAPGDRLYRTGDLARWRDDGVVELSGRADHQVKIRGFRVELGEIETAIQRLSGVHQAVVHAFASGNGERTLAAFVVAEPSRRALGIRADLAVTLPDYMVPATVTWLEALPRTANGKIDRAALPRPTLGDATLRTAPRDDTERAVAQVWQDVLGHAHLPSIEDRFFDIGGHSLLAMRVVAELRRRLRAEVPLATLFEAATLADFAARVAAAPPAPAAISARPAGNKAPLSHAQQRLWLIDQMHGGHSPHYHLPLVLDLRGELDLHRLRRALTQVATRHEVLRAVVREEAGQAWQDVQAPTPVDLQVADQGPGLDDEALDELIATFVDQPFDLAAAPPWRARVWSLAADHHVLAVVIHHIASDGWSAAIAVDEWRQAYADDGQTPPAPLAVQYGDFAYWDRQPAREAARARDLAYWMRQLADLPAADPLPLDRPRPARSDVRGAVHHSRLDAATSARLETLRRNSGATLFSVLHASLALLMARVGGSHDIVLGAPVANRHSAELEPLIGLFVNTLVLRVPVRLDEDFPTLLARCGQVGAQAQAHQDLPFDVLADAIAASTGRHEPLFRVMLSLQNNRRASLALPGLSVTAREPQRRTTQFELCLDVTEGEDGLRLSWEYATAVFDAATIAALDRQLHGLLETALTLPGTPVGDWPLGGTSEVRGTSAPAPASDITIATAAALDPTVTPTVENAVRPHVDPTTDTERLLASLWEELLKPGRAVSCGDNFFALGGHSLLAMRLMARLRESGRQVAVSDLLGAADLASLARILDARDQSPRTVFQAPPNLIPEGCARIVPSLLPLVALGQEEIDRIVGRVSGGAANIQDIYPLLPMQEGLLFLHMAAQGSGDPYVTPTLLRLADRAEAERFVRTVQQMVDRHDALRTAVLWEGLSRPVQVVWRQAPLSVNWRAAEPEEDVLARMLASCQQGRHVLPLHEAPLMRLEIAAEPSGAHLVLLTHHHLIFDHVGLDLIDAEWRLHQAGRQDELPEPVPLRDFVAQALHQQETGDATAHFRAVLGDVDTPTAPFGLLHAQGDGSDITQAERPLSPALSERLRQAARRRGMSPAVLFHVAWSMVLSACAGRDDVVFGTVLSGRLRGAAGIDATMGLFINTLPVRARLAGVGAEQALSAMNMALHGLVEHEQTPLALAQRCSGVTAPTPLFSAVLNYRHSVAPTSADTGALPVIAGEERTNYPFTLSVDDFGQDFTLVMQVDDRVGAERLLDATATALEQLIQALDTGSRDALLALATLPAAEQQRLARWNDTARELPGADELVHTLFDAQVERTPQAIAVSAEDGTLTYAELQARSNRLAQALAARGAGPDQLVGVCMERSADLVVALLGVLKAGAAYVPLDPDLPPARLGWILRDARPALVLTQQAIASRLADATAVVDAEAEAEANAGGSPPPEVLVLDAVPLRAMLDALPPVAPAQPALGPRHLVYTLYTSGSTGRPKGVMNEHAGVVNRLLWMQRVFALDADDRVLQKTPFGFDVSVWEFFWPLITGARVVMARPQGHRSPDYLARLIDEQGITTLHFVPSMLQAYLDGVPASTAHASLRLVFCSGEALAPVQRDRFLRRWPHAGLHNLYGPTEAAVDVSWHACVLGSPQGTVPIGAPIDNTRLHVLDAHGRPVPVGVPGEIHIAGVQVARGYLNRPDLTAERFVRDPFSTDPAARMYRTGDLGQWREDGQIEYLGRNDFQVKLRGQRIELGEIEAALTALPGVREAVTVLREDSPGDARLVAYLTLTEAAAPDAAHATGHDWAAKLATRLPSYMVPAAFIVLEAMPLSVNGKLDRAALPAPVVGSRGRHVPPATAAERLLATLWEELLSPGRPVSTRDNFFALGGHSLLSLRLLSRLREHGADVSIHQILEAADLGALAGAMEAAGPAAGAAFQAPPNLIAPGCARITPDMLPLVTLSQDEIDHIAARTPGGAANIQDIYPLMPLQEGMLFLHMAATQRSDPYVTPVLLALGGREETERFARTVQHLVARHDALRTAVLWDALPQPVQVVWREATLSVTWRRFGPGEDVMARMRELCARERQWLPLDEAPLMRMEIAEREDGSHLVVFSCHHLVFDHVGLEIIDTEWRLHEQGRQDELPVPVPYREFVAEALHRQAGPEAEAFFRAQLGDLASPTAPFDLLEVRGDGTDIAQAERALDPALSRRLREAARERGISPAALFHVAWAMVLATCSGRDDVAFGTVLSGRLHGRSGVESTMGLFINTLPVRARLAQASAEEAVETMSGVLRALVAHEQASLALAQRCSGVDARLPLFSALLNYRHTAPASASSGTGLRILDGEERTNYPFSLSVDDLGQDFELVMQTDAEVGAPRMLDFVVGALEGLTLALESADPRPVRALTALPDSEARLLARWNATERDLPADGLVHRAIARVAAARPDAPAVIDGELRWSYAELEARARHVALALRRVGVRAEDRVAVCARRSPELIAALLGVWKAGGAYLPLDPGYPAERLAQMLEDAGPRAVLRLGEVPAAVRDWPVASFDLAELLADGALADDAQADVRSAALSEDQADTQAKASADSPADAPAPALSDASNDAVLAAFEPWSLEPDLAGPAPSRLAYVMYTSGSTGRPKGVMVEHRGLLNYALDAARWFDLDADSVVLQQNSLNFDLSIEEIVPALLAGAALTPGREPLGTREQPGIASMVHLTAAHWHTLVGEWSQAPARAAVQLRGVRTVNVTGDAISLHKLAQWEALLATLWDEPSLRPRLVNTYGPTEITVSCSAAYVRHAEQGARVSIGRPFANTRLYVLDAAMSPVPAGVPGELWVGGVGVARGYLNRPDLTAERFVTDPSAGNSSAGNSSADGSSADGSLTDGSLTDGSLTDEPQARMYRTGDLVRWRLDGELEFIGRADFQAKVRGFRVEPGEVETVLARCEGVRDVVVVVRGSDAHEKALVAYHVGEADEATVAAHARRHLPEHLVPAAFMRLPQLPTSPNGKLDRGALPAPTQADAATSTPPEGADERQLASIWRDLLGVDAIGREHDFFLLGGHSLLAMRLLTRIRTAMGAELPLDTLFTASTLQAQAAAITQARTTARLSDRLAARADDMNEGFFL